jgi:uncharacterized membrane protein
MTVEDDNSIEAIGRPPFARSSLAASFVSLVGLADAVYLTVHHYTAEPVPCTVIAGCEQVLNSQYATLGGILTAILGGAAEGVATSGIGEIPLAALGGLAYFIAFSLALLTAYGNTAMWKLFGIQVVLMAIFTGWLIYLQGVVIGAFCQFCLISAATTFTLLAIFLVSKSPFRIRL